MSQPNTGAPRASRAQQPPLLDLIEALRVFVRYQPLSIVYPTTCGHDMLWIVDVAEDAPSPEECDRLAVLGFEWDEDAEAWGSYRFGSA